MVDSRIHYTSTQTSESLDIEEGVTSINLSGRNIISIDLRGLSSSISLKEMNLSNNRLQSIDLSHLSSCSSLEKVNLFRNALRYIDISAFSHCTELRELYLNLNRLSILDLTPLSACIHLKKLFFGSNHLREIDLYPLRTCLDLEWMSLARNQLSNADITPLLFCKKLGTLTFDDGVLLESLFLPRITRFHWGIEENRSAVVEMGLEDFIQRVGWSEVHSILVDLFSILDPLQLRDFQNSFLHRLGLDHFDVVDFDLVSLIDNLPQSTTFGTLKDKVRTAAYDALSDHIMNGGPTHFINIDEVQKNPDLAKLAPAILESRNRELSRIIIQETNGIFNLRPLWMTSYGFEILSALSMGLETDNDGMKKVIAHATQTGFNLTTKTIDQVKPEGNNVDTISQYILKRAEMTRNVM